MTNRATRILSAATLALSIAAAAVAEPARAEARPEPVPALLPTEVEAPTPEDERLAGLLAIDPVCLRCHWCP